jgi:hypothetical protein
MYILSHFLFSRSLALNRKKKKKKKKKIIYCHMVYTLLHYLKFLNNITLCSLHVIPIHFTLINVLCLK